MKLFQMIAIALFLQTDFMSTWPALTGKMEEATLNDDVATLRSIRASCLRAVASGLPADKVPLVRYAIAYADWRMVFNPAVAENERDGMLDEAESQLQQAIKANDKFAEAHALLGSVWGGKIAQSSLRGITLGPRVGTTMGRADALEPDNPRIVLQAGIGAFNTPSMFGGGNDKAEKLLRKAIMLFDKEPAEKAWPNWGRFDTHAWLGQTLVKKGDFNGARAEYQKALVLAPKSGWITYVLMPELEKAAKKKG
jgi:tetratricopeptide (TPR) repeat protein